MSVPFADVAEKLAHLEALEEALARSSSKLSELLSLIGESDEPSQVSRRAPVAWVAPDPDAPDGLGRIMLAWPAAAAESLIGDAPRLSQLAGVIDADSPLVASNVSVASGRAANDNALWVGEDGAGTGGLYGREPSVATLADGHTVIAWIGEDNIVHAALYPAEAAEQARLAYEASTLYPAPAMFPAIGDAAPGDEQAANRLKVAPTGPSSFTAVWVVELGIAAALAGQVFTREADALDRSGAEQWSTGTGWDAKPLPPVPVTGSGIGDLTIALNDAGGLVVGYTSTGESGARSSTGVVVEIDVADESPNQRDAPSLDLHAPTQAEDGVTAHDQLAALDGPVKPLPFGDATAPADDGSGDGDADVSRADGELTDKGTAAALDPDVRVIGSADGGLAQTLPNVAVAADGSIHVLSLGAGNEPGTSTITVTVADAAGVPLADANGDPRVIEVTHSAITEDLAKPQLDLTPVITAIGSGTGVGWVQAAGDAAHPGAKELVIQLYDEESRPVTDDPVTVAVTEDGTSTISDIDMAGFSSPGASGPRGASAMEAPGEEGEAAPSPAADLAVVWVKDAGDGGYGSVELQLFAIDPPVEAGGQAEVQALGSDGVRGGDDTPFQVERDDTPAVGRDPQVEGVRGGAVAVAWVTPSADGSAPEVVTGVVLDTRDGTQLVALNLTGFMPNGVAEGTEPTLQATNGGDIVVGWVQLVSDGGYHAEAAIYRFVSEGVWTRPTESVTLASFDALPDTYSIVVTNSDDPTIVVTWREDGDLLANRFGLDGDQIGDTFEVSTGRACHRHGGDAGLGDLGLSGSDGAGAALPDSNFVVAYTEANGTDTGIGAKVFSADGRVATAAPVADAVGDSNLTLEQANSVASAIATAAASVAPTQSRGSAPIAAAVEADLDLDVLTVVTDNAAADAARLVPPVSLAIADGPSAGDIAATIESYAGSTGSSVLHAGTGEGVVTESSPETLSFAQGFGNDALEPAPTGGPETHITDASAVAAAFDALQFANALYVEVNQDVIVFDTTNVVIIRTNITPPDEVI
jgi:hypothetical protein